MSAFDTIKKLKGEANRLLIVHYSCQSLNDANEGYSPRITSIAVLHVGSSSLHSFSIHLVAEIKNIARDQIRDYYDELEAEMLRDFYAFVREHSDHNWLHWNMSNINYGFETIEHRYRVLTKEVAPKVADSHKFNLSILVADMYGNNYADHPRMINLMRLNGGEHRDFLSGQDEVTAFEQQEYLKLHKSTMCKVYFFRKVFNLLADRKLKTQHSNMPARLNAAVESLPAKLLGLVAVLYAVFQLGILAYDTVVGKFVQESSTAIEQERNTRVD